MDQPSDGSPPPEGSPPPDGPPIVGAPPPAPQVPVGGWDLGLPPGVNPQAIAGPSPSSGAADSLALASLITGAVALLSSWCCLGLVLGGTGLVLGIIALGRVPSGHPGRGLAVAGMATSGLALAIWIGLHLVGVAFHLFSGSLWP